MAELRIPIIGEFKGKKAFGDAGKATNALDKGVKRLGASIAAVFGTQQLLRFAKNASKAFIEDEKAANRLAIAVKNLGLEFQSPRIERFISDLSAISGITDDQLRPAMQKLLTTTGSVTKAQELLTQALDISAGSGVDFETVANDLSMAYVGQTRGLRKYSLGLTQAELKTMSFTDVQERLNKQFSGANAQFLTTYAGKLQLITTAAGEASEKIGGALVDSLISVFAAGDVTKFVTQIDTLATKIANVVNSVVFGFQKLYILTSDRAILASLNPFDDYEKNALAAIEAAEKAAKFRLNAPTIGYLGSQPMNIYETSADAAKRKRTEADAAKRARELAAMQKKALDTQKKQNALTKASKVLDLDRISITAALRGQISETDRLSLGLQLALLDKNESAALKLSGELEAAVKRHKELSAALLATPEAPNPYRNWKPPGFVGPVMPEGVTPPIKNPMGIPYEELVPDFNVPDYMKQGGSITGRSANDYLGLGAIGAGATADAIVNVQVVLDGDVVGGAITNTQVNQSLSGTFSDVSRYNGRGAPSIK
jgi:hypothetical protein